MRNIGVDGCETNSCIDCGSLDRGNDNDAYDGSDANVGDCGGLNKLGLFTIEEGVWFSWELSILHF